MTPSNPLRRPHPLRRRIGGVLAAAGAAAVLGAVPAGADPAPSVPRGYPVPVDDVLGPQDPGFWDPAVEGTRILTPVGPGVRVDCASGFEPPPGVLDARYARSEHPAAVPGAHRRPHDRRPAAARVGGHPAPLG